MLGRLGLQLARRRDVRHQRHVDEQRVLAAQFLAHLADGFDERQRLDVAHRAADLDDHQINVGGDLLHRALDFVGDMRDDLHGLAQVVAATFFGDDGFVDAAGGPVVLARELAVGEALVVAKVEVGLGAVVGDEDLAVLERRHGAGIDVEVRIELLQSDFQPAAFHQAADGCSRQALAKRRHDTAGHKDVLCRHRFLCCWDLCRRERSESPLVFRGALYASVSAQSGWSEYACTTNYDWKRSLEQDGLCSRERLFVWGRTTFRATGLIPELLTEYRQHTRA